MYSFVNNITCAISLPCNQTVKDEPVTKTRFCSYETSFAFITETQTVSEYWTTKGHKWWPTVTGSYPYSPSNTRYGWTAGWWSRIRYHAYTISPYIWYPTSDVNFFFLNCAIILFLCSVCLPQIRNIWCCEMYEHHQWGTKCWIFVLLLVVEKGY